MLLTAAAGAATASAAKAWRCGAPTPTAPHIDIPDQASLFKMLKAGPATSGGKTYRLAANTDFGTAGIYGYDFRSNPITITGQVGTRFQWLDFAGSQGITWRDFNVYGGQAGAANAAVAIHDHSGDLTFQGVTILTGATEGTPADGCGWFVRNCTNNIQIIGQRDASKPDVSGKGNAVNLSQCSDVTVKNLTITNNGSDGILLAGASDCNVDGCFGTNFYPAPGDHPDFIQGFNAYDGTPIKNISVKNCGWMRGNGKVCQGYFFEDVDNLVIKDSWLYGGMINSVSVSRGKTSTIIDDCYFVGFSDYGSCTTIRGGTVNAAITNTYVGAVNDYRGDGANPGFSQSGNKRTKEVKPGDYAGLDAWLASHPGARARL
jgi:parallel beta-helix repeat protein